MRLPEGEESDQGIENLFKEIITENFPSLVKEKDTQVQEAQRVPNKLDLKRPMLRHNIIKMTRLKDKERILKATRKKQAVTYKGAPIRLSSDFSTETYQHRRDWHKTLKVVKSTDPYPRLIFPARLSFKIEDK